MSLLLGCEGPEEKDDPAGTGKTPVRATPWPGPGSAGERREGAVFGAALLMGDCVRGTSQWPLGAGFAGVSAGGAPSAAPMTHAVTEAAGGFCVTPDGSFNAWLQITNVFCCGTLIKLLLPAGVLWCCERSRLPAPLPGFEMQMGFVLLSHNCSASARASRGTRRIASPRAAVYTVRYSW